MSTIPYLTAISKQAFSDEIEKVALVGKGKLSSAIVKRVVNSGHRITFDHPLDLFWMKGGMKKGLKDLMQKPGKTLGAKIRANPDSEISHTLDFLKSVKKSGAPGVIHRDMRQISRL